ncbi:hypothetical protein F5148DRAFT_789859 [Russula earlei]|uniref:Uncharacterized protein n=1 Tax=Russula earlei TaxID=71964 RepID=A0ACC0ULU1_9AGAM|nr:hypothetical protein F5148DRAFT_789859 [Russula earlei]
MSGRSPYGTRRLPRHSSSAYQAAANATLPAIISQLPPTWIGPVPRRQRPGSNLHPGWHDGAQVLSHPQMYAQSGTGQTLARPGIEGGFSTTRVPINFYQSPRPRPADNTTVYTRHSGGWHALSPGHGVSMTREPETPAHSRQSIWQSHTAISPQPLPHMDLPIRNTAPAPQHVPSSVIPEHPLPTPPLSAHGDPGPMEIPFAMDICPFPNCGRSFGRPQDLERHVLQHLPRWIHCARCNWTGNRRYALRVHLEMKHGGLPVPEPGSYTIYDAKRIVKLLLSREVTLALAENEARSSFRNRAAQLGMAGHWRQ